MDTDRIVKSIIERYHPSAHYLLDAKIINERRIKGKFMVSNSYHLVGKKLKHLAITESQTCINQLFQVFVAKAIESGYIKEWGKLKWSDYWGKLSSEHLFVVDSHTKFNEMILPDNEFYGVLILHNEFKSNRGNYHLTFHFDLNEGAHVGEIRIAFVP